MSPAVNFTGQAASKESLEEWEDKILSAIFRLTLDAARPYDHMNHKLYYVEAVKQELEEQGASLKVDLTILDQAILEAASGQSSSSPFEYMLACWKRVSRQFKNLKAKPDDAKLSIIKEARRICMSYCVFAVSMPEMFGRESSLLLNNPLVPPLLESSDDDKILCHDFLQEISSRFEEDESAKEIIVQAIEEICIELASKTMNDAYQQYIQVSDAKSRT